MISLSHLQQFYSFWGLFFYEFDLNEQPVIIYKYWGLLFVWMYTFLSILLVKSLKLESCKNVLV